MNVCGGLQIPFGIAQIGKAFRNEITPRNFIFRSREFEQMEIEYFITPDDDAWQKVGYRGEGCKRLLSRIAALFIKMWSAYVYMYGMQYSCLLNLNYPLVPCVTGRR